MNKLEIIKEEKGLFKLITPNDTWNHLTIPSLSEKVLEFCLQEEPKNIFIPPKDTLVEILSEEGCITALRYSTGELSKDGISLYCYNNGATSLTHCGCSVQYNWRIAPGYWVNFSGDTCPVPPETIVNIKEFGGSSFGNRRAKEINWVQRHPASTNIIAFKVHKYP